MPLAVPVLLAVVAIAALASPPLQFSLSGVVTDAMSGAPIKGAVVTVSGDAPPVLISTLSFEDGRFVVSDLPAGRFSVRVSKAAFVDATYGSTWHGEPGVPVVLSGAQPSQNVTIALKRSAVLFGEVRDGRGAVAAGATITVFRITELGSSRHAEKVRTVRTDDRGRYRVFGLESGFFALSVLSGDRSVGTRAGMSEQRIDLMLKALREGRRTALPEDASPTANTFDEAELAPVFFPGGGTAGPIGSFELEFGDEERVDMRIPTSWAGAINGRVLGLEAGLKAHVTVQPRVAIDTGPIDQRARSTQTAVDGTFSFRALSPGAYTVTARVEGDGGSGAEGRFGRSVVDVGGGQSASLTMTVRPGLTISGRVVLSEGSTSRARPPVISVQLVAIEGGRVSQPALRATSTDGRFQLHNVPPERYRVSVSANASDGNTRWVAESVACAGVDALDVPCDLSLGNAEELVVTMTDSRSGVSGWLDTGGALAPDTVMVVAFPVREDEWREDSRRIKVARLAADGQFSFDLPPGTYFLGVVQSTVVAQAISSEVLNRLKSAAVSVSVPKGQIVRQGIRVGREALRALR